MATFREIAEQLVIDHVDFEAWDGYAEPGYDLRDDQIGIVFANWNNKSHYDRETHEFVITDNTMPRLARIAEWLGFVTEWSDEWSVCECGKAFRISGDSYSWTMYGHWFDEWVECGDCIKENPSDYIEDIEDKHRKANTIWGLDLTEHGYARVDVEFEHGLYGGQDACPEVILKTLNGAGVCGVVFNVDATGQFDCAFSAYVRKEDLKEAQEALAGGDTKCDIDPATAMDMALRDASAKMAQLEGDGIKYAQCKEDGTADVRLVSPQEWVEGIK